MDVPDGQRGFPGDSCISLSEVRKVTHLNVGKTRGSRNISKSITVATAVLRNTFDGM